MGERVFTRDDAQSLIRTNTEKVKIPADFTAIGTSSLAGFSQLKELVIPEGVTRIETHAFFARTFKNTSNLEKLTIPASVTDFGMWCFYDLNSLDTVVLPEDFPEKKALELFFHVPSATLKFGKTLFGAKKTKTVSQIMDENPGTLERSVSGMLKPDDNGVLEIPPQYYCVLAHAMTPLANRGIKKLVVSASLRMIAPNAFSCLNGLTEVEFKDGVQYIDNCAFAGCKQLRKVTIPDSVERIGAGAFMNDPKLETVVLPRNLIAVPDDMFSGCTSLKKVTFGDKISAIGAGAFYGCSSIQTMMLPETVKTVGTLAFWDCSALQRCYIPPATEKVNKSAFGNCMSLLTLYMPRIIHDQLESKQIFGDLTNPDITWMDEGASRPLWDVDEQLPEIAAPEAGGAIPEVPTRVLPGRGNAAAAESASAAAKAANTPAAGGAPGFPVNLGKGEEPQSAENASGTPAAQNGSGNGYGGNSADAEKVRMLEETLAQMQKQLESLQNAQNQAAAAAAQPAVSAEEIRQLNQNFAAMQTQIEAVNSLSGSAQAISSMQKQVEDIASMQSRVDEIAAKQESVQEQVQALSGISEKIDAIADMADIKETVGTLSGMQQAMVRVISDQHLKTDKLSGTISEMKEQINAVSEMREQISAVSEMKEQLDAVSGMKEKIAQISEVNEQVSKISEIQQKVEQISEHQEELDQFASTISEVKEQASAIADVRERVSALNGIQEQVSVIPKIQQKVEEISEKQEQLSVVAASSAAQGGKPDYDSKVGLVPVIPEDTVQSEKTFSYMVSKQLEGPKERSEALKNYTVIGYRAFREADGGERFEIPEGVKRICTQAFWDSPRLLALEIPNSLEEIEPDAFSGISHLTDVYVPENFPERKAVEWFLFRPEVKLHFGKRKLIKKERIVTVAELMEQYDDILTAQKVKKMTVRSHILRIPEGFVTVAPNVTEFLDMRLEEPEHALQTIILPKSVRRIAARAFTGAESVKHIVIPEGLQIVDMNAFSGCLGPRRLVLPDSVKYIGPYAFAAPCQYEQIRLPKHLNVLPENLLSNCNTLVYLQIPNSVQKIGNAALSGCTALTNLTIPKRFEEQLPEILDGPVKLNVRFTIDEERQPYEAEPPKALLNVVDVNLKPVPFTRLFTPEISAQCTNFAERLEQLRSHPYIGTNGLADMANQTKFEIPLGVMRLGCYVFGANQRLLTLTVPKALHEFDYGAFFGCERLRDVFLPDEFSRDAAAALFMFRPSILIFFGNARPVCVRQLTQECPWILSANDAANLDIVNGTMTVPEGYVAIASYMYHGLNGKENLKRIVLPSSVRMIGAQAFDRLPELEEVVCADGLKAIESTAFVDCPSLKRIVLPGTLQFLGVNAFSGCSELESLYLPKKFVAFAEGIQRECAKVKITWIDDVVLTPAPKTEERVTPAVEEEKPPVEEKIESSAISETIASVADTEETKAEAAEERVLIAQEEIEATTEEAEESEEEVEIPDIAPILEEIETPTEEAEESEEEAENPDIAPILEEIETQTEETEESEEEVEIPDIAPILEDIETPTEETEESEEEVEIPDIAPILEEIGDTGITADSLPVLEEITAPAAKAEEPKRSLDSLPVLEEITAPSAASADEPEEIPGLDPIFETAVHEPKEPEVQHLAIEDMPQLEALNGEATAPSWGHGGEIPAKDMPMLEEIKSASKKPQPNAWTHTEVRFTAKECRKQYHGESEYTIPEGYQEIRAGACAGLDDLVSLTLPNTVTKIYAAAFADCSALETVFIPLSVTEIEDDAFEGCDALLRVTMPRIFEEMAGKLFRDSVEITWLDEPKATVQIIGDGKYTAKIRRKEYNDEPVLEIPEGYLEIRAGACAGLEELESVSLPESLRKICSGAFADCISLTGISIPKNVEEIEEDAFEGCTALTTVALSHGLSESIKNAFPSHGINFIYLD